MDSDLETILLFDQHGSVCGCPEFWGYTPWTSASTCPTVDIQDVWKSQLRSSPKTGAEQDKGSPSSNFALVASEIPPSATTKTSTENKSQSDPTMYTSLGSPGLDEARPNPTGPPRETCIFWYHGACRRGNQCQFAHESHITWPINMPPGYTHNFSCRLPLCPLRAGMAELVGGMVARAGNIECSSHGNTDTKENLEKEETPVDTCFFWYHGNCRRGDQCHLAHEIIGANIIHPPPEYRIDEHQCELPLCSISTATGVTVGGIIQGEHVPESEMMSTEGEGTGDTDSDSECSSGDDDSHNSSPHDAAFQDKEISDSESESGSESTGDEIQEGVFDAINMVARSPSTFSSCWSTTTFSSRQSFTPEPEQQLSSQREEFDERVGEEDKNNEIEQACHSANYKRRSPLPPQDLSVRDTKLKYSTPVSFNSAIKTPRTIDQIPSVLQQAPSAPKVCASNRLQLCFFWYHTGRCSRHQEKACRFWHQKNFKGIPIRKVALPPNLNSMTHDPNCQLAHCPLRMLRRKQEVEYYEDMNQDLIRENMRMEEAARQQHIKVEAPTDDSFDFASVPTGPKAERGNNDRSHPSTQSSLTEVKLEEIEKGKNTGAKKQDTREKNQQKSGRKQKRKSGRAGQRQAKGSHGARVGPGGGVQKPKRNRKSRWRNNGRGLMKLEALADGNTGPGGLTGGLDALGSVKPKGRPARENPNLIPLGPKRKDLSPLQGLRGAQLAEMDKLDRGHQDLNAMGDAEAQPWFLTGFPDQEDAAPQAKILVDYTLPKGNERAKWDTDFLRKVFGEIP